MYTNTAVILVIEIILNGASFARAGWRLILRLESVEMKTIFIIAMFILMSGCGDSTGPSPILRNQLVVIDTATGSICETVNLEFGTDCEAEISSDGNFIYFTGANLIKLNLNSMIVESELSMFSGCMAAADLSENDSLLFALDTSAGMLYKITTADMAIADTLALNSFIYHIIGTRPGTDLLYMATGNEQIHILNTAQMTFKDTLNISFDSEIHFSDSGDEMYLFSCGSLNAYDPDTGQRIREHFFPGVINLMEVPCGSSSMFILWCTLSGTQYDLTLVELDRSTFTIEETSELSYNPWMIRYSESLRRLFLYPTQDHNILVLDMPGFQPAGEVDVDDYVVEMVLSPTADRLYCFIYYNSNPDVD